MSDGERRTRDRRLRGRARLLEFLKFRVLASQEAFFATWILEEDPKKAPGHPGDHRPELPPLDLVAFRRWLQPLWPEAAALADGDLRHCLEQAHRLYIDAEPQRRA
jgi:hypothetical protein